MIFENLNNPDNKDQKLSLAERSVIKIIKPFATLILWKLARAKTYGDLNKIGEYLSTKIDNIEERHPKDGKRQYGEAEALDIAEKEIDQLAKGLKDL